jgi:hypothetical protein
MPRVRTLRAYALSAAVAVALVAMIKLTGIGERLAYLPDRATPPAPEGVEELSFTTEDGLVLHGWLLRADRPHPAPAVLMTHGNAGNVSDHVPFVEFLPAAGYHVLVFDYRSYGKSERGGLRRRNLLLDTRAAYRALVEHPDVDPDRVGLFAQSIGAAFGLHLMADEPRVGAAVVMSGFSRWREAAASVLGGARTGPISRGLAWLVMPEGLEPIDALRRIERRPVLLVHGDADEIVPHAHAERMHAAGGSNVGLVTVESGGHNDLRRVDPGLDGRIVAFFDEHLR